MNNEKYKQMKSNLDKIEDLQKKISDMRRFLTGVKDGIEQRSRSSLNLKPYKPFCLKVYGVKLGFEYNYYLELGNYPELCKEIIELMEKHLDLMKQAYDEA